MPEPQFDQAAYDKKCKARQAKNKVRMMHHHAYLAKDMEETRKFYEDLLSMPLIGTWIERTNPVTGEPDNYIHTFFELGDGSCLSFFQFKNVEQNADHAIQRFEQINPFTHHIAIEVTDDDALQEYRKRLDEADYPYVLTDHGYLSSIYLHDPNGMQVELTTRVPNTDVMMARAGDDARSILDRWMAEDDVPTNNFERGAGWVAKDAQA
jgi:catechol 2,3-dioxygenase-like lactoylglutathione lyase family enzyme